MQDWHSTCLGRRTLPRDLSAFEIEAFFNFCDAERRVIEDRRGPALKLALALQIGFLRMTGRLLASSKRCASYPRHCGGIWVSNSASLRLTWHRCDRCINVGARCSSTRKWPARRLAFTGYRRPSGVRWCGYCAVSFRARAIGSGCCSLHVAGFTSID
jgi:hypothetical protein